jgi:hypothetical protein
MRVCMVPLGKWSKKKSRILWIILRLAVIAYLISIVS